MGIFDHHARSRDRKDAAEIKRLRRLGARVAEETARRDAEESLTKAEEAMKMGKRKQVERWLLEADASQDAAVNIALNEFL